MVCTPACTELSAGREGLGGGPWYLVPNDLPLAGGQRLPPEGPRAGIQLQLLRLLRHWKRRKTESQVGLAEKV